MFYRLSAAAVLIVLVLAGAAQGQLSKAQIDSLREVGQREGWTFTVSENEATRRPLHELSGSRLPADWSDNLISATSMPTYALPLPSSFDWRTLGGVTPIKNQGQCGSCWAFATVGALECNIAIRDDLILDLSEQYLVSCNFDGWSCAGGQMAHNYHLIDTHPQCAEVFGYGPIFESSYPYTANDAVCDMGKLAHQTAYCLQDWDYLPVNPVTRLPYPEDVKEAIMRYGPVFVYVETDDAFQAYDEGVFNACPTLPINQVNHAVCLVGWDDDQGSEGVWILRNSWGPTWGENGYMLIEYGCMNVGVGVNYVDYDLPKVVPYCDVQVGWVPLDVNFDAITDVSADSWHWEFGDGGTADIRDPSHTYNLRGSHDLTVEVTSGVDVHSNTLEGFIVAIADTLIGDSVANTPGQQVVMTLSAYNAMPVDEITIPVEWSGDLDFGVPSLSTTGCRTAGSLPIQWVNYESSMDRFTIRLRSGTSSDFAVGDGPILKLTFTIPNPSSAGDMSTVSFDGYVSNLGTPYNPLYEGLKATYEPASIAGKIVSKGCCQMRGNLDGDADVDISDVDYFVSWTFGGGPAAGCADDADVDGNGRLDIEDLVYLVNYIYASGAAPVSCP